ncbi:MAG: serine/threonine protein kinase [Planctomycetota bacterium]|nr:MAG: serine/threonine protein kinase [Planctomycetota bacterium]
MRELAHFGVGVPEELDQPLHGEPCREPARKGNGREAGAAIARVLAPGTQQPRRELGIAQTQRARRVQARPRVARRRGGLAQEELHARQGARVAVGRQPPQGGPAHRRLGVRQGFRERRAAVRAPCLACAECVRSLAAEGRRGPPASGLAQDPRQGGHGLGHPEPSERMHGGLPRDPRTGGVRGCRREDFGLPPQPQDLRQDRRAGAPRPPRIGLPEDPLHQGPHPGRAEFRERLGDVLGEGVVEAHGRFHEGAQVDRAALGVEPQQRDAQRGTLSPIEAPRFRGQLGQGGDGLAAATAGEGLGDTNLQLRPGAVGSQEAGGELAERRPRAVDEGQPLVHEQVPVGGTLAEGEEHPREHLLRSSRGEGPQASPTRRRLGERSRRDFLQQRDDLGATGPPAEPDGNGPQGAARRGKVEQRIGGQLDEFAHLAGGELASNGGQAFAFRPPRRRFGAVAQRAKPRQEAPARAHPRRRAGSHRRHSVAREPFQRAQHLRRVPERAQDHRRAPTQAGIPPPRQDTQQVALEARTPTPPSGEVLAGSVEVALGLGPSEPALEFVALGPSGSNQEQSGQQQRQGNERRSHGGVRRPDPCPQPTLSLRCPLMSGAMDSDLRLGQLAVRMGLIEPQQLAPLLQEARAGHAEESAGKATSLAQVLLRRRLLTVSDYVFIARQAKLEQESGLGEQELERVAHALEDYRSGSLDASSFEEILSTSGEPLRRPQDVVQRFGRYELLEEIGRGGMGIVYKARDPERDRLVALKVMIEADDDEVRVARFQREAELAGSLDHPGIVKIHDAGQVEGIPYFTMDLVVGDSLDDLLEGQGVDRDLALRVVAQAARAVDHAHERGIVHRDLKPGNIIIDRRTREAKITDFGLARDLARTTRLTQVGQAVGTPYYMAPEQVRGERDVDGRCDIYALGVILYEVLTGDVPFDADSPLSLFKKIDREEVVLPLDPEAGIDEGIRSIALTALAKDREQRYARGRLLAEDLERYLRGEAPRLTTRPWNERLRERLWGSTLAQAATLLAALAVVVFVALGAALWRRSALREERRLARAAGDEALARARKALEAARRALAADDARAAADASARGQESLRRFGEGGLALLRAQRPERAWDPSAVAAGTAEAWRSGAGEDLWERLGLLRARALLALDRKGEGDPAEDPAAAAERTLRELVERHPDAPAPRLLLAEHLLEAGRAEAAAQALAPLLEADPTHPEALRLRARCSVARGRLEDALADLSQLLLRRPDDAGALVERAGVALRLGRRAAARADAENARALAPERADTHLVAGDVAAAEGLAVEASAAYREAALRDPEDPRPWLHEARLRFARGSYEAAERAYTEAERRGAGVDAALGAARANAFLCRVQAASRCLERAATLAARLRGPARARAEAERGTLRAVVHLLADETDAARRALAAAGQADPSAPEPRVWQARLALAEGNDAAARAALAPLPDAGAPSAVLALRSALARRAGDARAAVELAERALASAAASEVPRARVALALARVLRGLSDTARAACDAAWLAGQGGDLAGELVRRGRELEALGRARAAPESLRRRAERLLTAALRLDPDRAPAWEALARWHLAQGHLADALRCARSGLALDPFRPALARVLATSALEEGNPPALQEAEAAMARVLEHQGRTGRDLLLLARCRAALSRWEAALSALDQAARLGASHGAVEALRQRVLTALGRAAEASLAAARARELGPERAERRSRLLAEARALRDEDPGRALDLARRSLALAARPDTGAGTQAALLAARLCPEPEARLEFVVPCLLAGNGTRLNRSDAILAEVWERPLPPATRRRLVREASAGPPAAALAVALAALEDALAGEADSRWLGEGLAHAERVLSEAPACAAAHAARGLLRARLGDPLRAQRELGPACERYPACALLRYALAEARARSGRLAEAAFDEARRLGLPRASERRQRSGAWSDAR